MNVFIKVVVVVSALLVGLSAGRSLELRAGEFSSLFDGKTLTGWNGDSDYWSVEDGALTGDSTDKKLKASTYIYSDDSFDDFELHFKFRITSEWGNSGVQYRSRVKDKSKYTIDGYQADIETGDSYSGILYEVGGRKFIARRGEQVQIAKDGKKTIVGQTCDPAIAQNAIKNGAWSDYVVIAYKNKLRHIINGFVTVEVEDNEPGKGALSGIFAFQMHQGPSMKVQFKDIKIKKIKAFPSAPVRGEAELKKAVSPKLRKSAGLDLMPGFEAELVYSADLKTQNSWISMTFDDKGRIIATTEDKRMFRLSLPESGGSVDVKSEQLRVEGVSDVRGLLYAFDSLYVASSEGVLRLQDSNGDDKFDKVTTILSQVTSVSAHGSHAMIVSPDGKGIHFINGNMGVFQNNMPSRQPRVWAEDSLLPHTLIGHARNIKAPGGWICRFDPDGGNPVMIASGFRNACDIAFNREGELFTYDADMEYDMGTSWYRPTRINHVVSGAEYGWRSGSQKWPDYYPDSVGSVHDVGPGSPTGIAFGYQATFPQRYRDALFVCDWSFGVLYAVHLSESGSTYQAVKEPFVRKMGFPLVDVEVGPDGALYLLTGGWRNQSHVYRIRYTGGESTRDVARASGNQATRLRGLRREIESDHRVVGAKAVQANWKYLAHGERPIRYAARIAIENQALEHWQDRVFAEKNPVAMIHAVLALVRHADKGLMEKAVNHLGQIRFQELSTEHQLNLLRAYGLMFARWGQPSEAVGQTVVQKINPHYPASDRFVNRELSRLLAYLEAPDVVSKTIALMETEKVELDGYYIEALKTDALANNRNYGNSIDQLIKNYPNVQNVHHLYALKSVTRGWSPETRTAYFTHLMKSMKRNGGAKYQQYLNDIKSTALENAPEDQREVLAQIVTSKQAPLDISKLPQAKGPGKAWEAKEVVALLETGLKNRDFENGKKMFKAAHCSSCHMFNGEGGAAGPDLSNLANRFPVESIIESINEPSKVINKFYLTSEITMKDGAVHYGQVLRKNRGQLKVMKNPYAPSDLTAIKEGQIATEKPSPISQMPPRLISILNQDELLDFMAYILSKGNRQHAYFE